MSKRKKKITKLTDEQYYSYIMSLKDEPALYGLDGEAFIPEEVAPQEKAPGDDFKE